LIADEIYSAITGNSKDTDLLSQVVGNRPAISMKGISKELPWPGSRCGWMEFYNRGKDPQFDQFCKTLENAKMVEVCSTTLPQMAIPQVFTDPRYESYLAKRNKAIFRRGEILEEIFSDMPEIRFSPTRGAFYNTIIFNESHLNGSQSMYVPDPLARQLVKGWVTKSMAPDRKFVYYLLASRGICVVPLSSFQSELQGFRITLLEEDEELFTDTFTQVREAIQEFCHS
jgi:aspartate/methionine/tyrosine aminotransferase